MGDEAYKRGYDKIQWKPLPPPERPERGPSRRADFPTPMMIRDFDEPVQSMADGKFYTSKAALSRSARADHNPHGVDFIELGNEEQKFQEYKPDLKAEREVLRKAKYDVDNGWRPDVLKLDD